MDKALLKKQFDELNVSLLILQFGGNTVPYVESDEKAESYGKWFGSQIRLLKQLIPGVSILVIGPSDMATKVKNDFETYPYLLPVRNALKKAAFDHGCAFWDLYEVMGGKNSMEVWVNAEPPLAGKDYVHFTPKGARKVAELLHKAIRDEYQKWKEDQ
jgi:lysophospholipase L1-like esterase